MASRRSVAGYSIVGRSFPWTTPISSHILKSDFDDVNWLYSNDFCQRRIVRIDSRLVSTLGLFSMFWNFFILSRYPSLKKVSRWCAWTYWAMLLNPLTMPKSEVNAKFWSGHVRKSSLNSWKSWWATVSFGWYQLYMINL